MVAGIVITVLLVILAAVCIFAFGVFKAMNEDNPYRTKN